MAYEDEDMVNSLPEKEASRKNSKDNKKFLKRITSFFSFLVQTPQAEAPTTSTRFQELATESSEIEAPTTGIRELVIERLQTYQAPTDVEVTRKTRPKTYPYCFTDGNVVGIEKDVEKLVCQLINKEENKAKILAIVGMGGSGKTTLARKIYNHHEIERKFDCQAWISVSQAWSSESLLREIFRQTTGQKSDTLTIDETVEELRKFLHNKSYLVVLDDVWEQDALRQIMLPATSPGSKFVITTRIKRVVWFPDLGCFVHEPRPLTPQESWKLFKKIALHHQSDNVIDHDDDPHVVLGMEMLRKCDGLPLAVISLAGLLSTKETIHEWEIVKNVVSSKIIQDAGPADYGRVEDMLALSYSDLDNTLKSCFLYLGLFPEDAEIPTGMLMRSWIAEAFIKSLQPSANETVEDVARQCLDELIQRCLVQIARINHAGVAKAIRVHDLMRDLSIKRAKDLYFLDTSPLTSSAIDWPSTSAGTTTLHPLRFGALTGDAVQEGQGSRLRSFVRFLNVTGSDDRGIARMSLRPIFTNYTLLRVLNLRGTHSYDWSLPDEIGNLIHLRYLGLTATNIPTLPESINSLRNLLTLEYQISTRYAGTLVGDYRGKLPNLRHMKHLRHLYLPENGLYYKKELNLQDLRSLQVLWGISAGLWITTELKELSTTVQKLGILEIRNPEQLQAVYRCPSIIQDRLHTLKLQWWRGAELELQKLQHCKRLQKLILDGVIAKCAPFAFPTYLLKLVLVYTRIEDKDSFAASLGRLPYLKVLWLQDNAYMDSHLNFAADSFLKLEDLQLSTLPNLVELLITKGAMPRLKKLKLDNCRELKALPQGLKTITTLQQLEIRHMGAELYSRIREAETRSQRGGEDLHIIQRIPSVALF